VCGSAGTFFALHGLDTCTASLRLAAEFLVTSPCSQSRIMIVLVVASYIGSASARRCLMYLRSDRQREATSWQVPQIESFDRALLNSEPHTPMLGGLKRCDVVWLPCTRRSDQAASPLGRARALGRARTALVLVCVVVVAAAAGAARAGAPAAAAFLLVAPHPEPLVDE